MIYSTYCLESFQAAVQKEGTQKEPSSLPEKTEFGEVKVARTHGAEYWRGKCHRE